MITGAAIGAALGLAWILWVNERLRSRWEEGLATSVLIGTIVGGLIGAAL